MKDKPGEDRSTIVQAGKVGDNLYHQAVSNQSRAIAQDIMAGLAMQVPDMQVHLNALILALCQHIVGTSMGQQELIDKRTELVISTMKQNLPVYREDFLRFLQHKAQKEGKQ